jgi:hypothetical protein
VLQIITDIFDLVSNIAVIVGVPIALYTLKYAVLGLKADNERRKKQSTIEFYQEIFSLVEPLKIELNDKFKYNAINPTASEYTDDRVLQDNIINYLVCMERFSVGVNIGVYDIDVYMRCTGRATIAMFEQLHPVIMERRRTTGNYLYTDFEKMVNLMRKKYQKKNNKGTIKYQI